MSDFHSSASAYLFLIYIYTRDCSLVHRTTEKLLIGLCLKSILLIFIESSLIVFIDLLICCLIGISGTACITTTKKTKYNKTEESINSLLFLTNDEYPVYCLTTEKNVCIHLNFLFYIHPQPTKINWIKTIFLFQLNKAYSSLFEDIFWFPKQVERIESHVEYLMSENRSPSFSFNCPQSKGSCVR